MSTTAPPAGPEIDYPSSDGQPMADNTLQFQWIVTIQGNLDVLFRDRPDVFVAGDHLIYPVEGEVGIRQAPDVYVAIGRPKGHRGSYRVWEEAGIFPQVIFEVWSPGNRAGDMLKRRKFYRRYGAEEYYLLYPEDNAVEGWLRQGRRFEEIDETNGFASPRLGVRFDTSGPYLRLFGPTGEPFQTVLELAAARDAERRENDRLRALLRAAGIDPGAVPPG